MNEILRTEQEIEEIIKQQEKEEALKDTMGFSLSEFEIILKLNILDEARKMKIIHPHFGSEPETEVEKLNILKRQKFACWFIWDGLNVVRMEKGLIANIYIHTSGKDIIHNKAIWHMIRSALNRCHSKEGGLVENTALELRSKLLELSIGHDIRRANKQFIVIEDREEEFDLIPSYRILTEESEVYQVILTDRRTGIKAVGRGSIKYRNQIDWGTKLELSRKVREYEFSNRTLEETENG